MHPPPPPPSPSSSWSCVSFIPGDSRERILYTRRLFGPAAQCNARDNRRLLAAALPVPPPPPSPSKVKKVDHSRLLPPSSAASSQTLCPPRASSRLPPLHPSTPTQTKPGPRIPLSWAPPPLMSTGAALFLLILPHHPTETRSVRLLTHSSQLWRHPGATASAPSTSYTGSVVVCLSVACLCSVLSVSALC